jgi:hypothetical protein
MANRLPEQADLLSAYIVKEVRPRGRFTEMDKCKKDSMRSDRTDLKRGLCAIYIIAA